VVKELFQTKSIVQIGLLIIGYSLIALAIPRMEFTSFLAVYSALFVGYFYLVRNDLSIQSIFVIGMIARVIFLFSTPSLSDDIYRFLWDGRLWVQGENPFQHIPQYFNENQGNLIGLDELYPKLNSKQYFAIYPPINQFIFGIAALIAPLGFFKAQFVIKIILIAGEVLLFQYAVKLLKHLNKNRALVALYFLNPLVIIEVTGNLHFEGLMATFLIMAFYYLKTERWAVSAVFMAFGVCTKLIPLLYLPLVLPFLGFIKTTKYISIVGIVSALLFIPFMNLELALNMLNSIDLYFQSFIFNSFVYSILIDISGDESKKWIAFVLALVPVFAVLRLAFKNSNFENLMQRSFWVHSLYYFFSAVVHPWYLVTLLALNIFQELKYILFWSYLIGLTYFTYRTLPYEESSFIIALEYVVVITWVLIDFFRSRKKQAVATH
jgi:alpha-1,6-mannosyltransferase